MQGIGRTMPSTIFPQPRRGSVPKNGIALEPDSQLDREPDAPIWSAGFQAHGQHVRKLSRNGLVGDYSLQVGLCPAIPPDYWLFTLTFPGAVNPHYRSVIKLASLGFEMSDRAGFNGHPDLIPAVN